MADWVKPAHFAAAVIGDIPADASLPRTAVIGAGSSGIPTAKALSTASVPFDCFERGTAIGGNWLLDNPNGQSTCYETLEITTSCPRMVFSDVPLPGNYPLCPRHELVHAYFEKYVVHFGFRHKITFSTTVEQVSRDMGGGWLVRISGPGGERRQRCDAVLVANGHH